MKEKRRKVMRELCRNRSPWSENCNVFWRSLLIVRRAVRFTRQKHKNWINKFNCSLLRLNLSELVRKLSTLEVKWENIIIMAPKIVLQMTKIQVHSKMKFYGCREVIWERWKIKKIWRESWQIGSESNEKLRIGLRRKFRLSTKSRAPIRVCEPSETI